ncbi:MAG: response regulator [Nitrospirota bacterium]|jgi:CheY-like chemotaxis protein
MKRILIVEDEPHVARVLRLRLERVGYGVVTAAHGEAALAAIEQSPPDGVITDIQMPRMTGRELCERIEALFPDRTFPILVLTSRAEVEHREWSQKMANTVFLEKPASISRILSALEAHFGAGQMLKR